MATIATLDTVLRAKTRQFDRQIKKSGDTVSSFKRILTGIGAVATGATGTMVALGKQVLSLSEKFAGLGDDIAKGAQQLQISTGDFQSLTFAIERSGGSVNSLKNGMRTMTRQFYNASRGSSEALDAFAGLGLSFESLAGMDPADQFRTIAEALTRVEDETTKAGLAQAVFGRSASELIPFLDNVPAKKTVIFCDGEVFSLDRGLLMGARSPTIWFYNKITYIICISQGFQGCQHRRSIAAILHLKFSFCRRQGDSH